MTLFSSNVTGNPHHLSLTWALPIIPMSETFNFHQLDSLSAFTLSKSNALTVPFGAAWRQASLSLFSDCIRSRHDATSTPSERPVLLH